MPDVCEVEVSSCSVKPAVEVNESEANDPVVKSDMPIKAVAINTKSNKSLWVISGVVFLLAVAGIALLGRKKYDKK